MNGLTDAQVKAFAIDADHARRRSRRQACLLYVVSNRRAVVLIHMLKHVDLAPACRCKGVGQCHLIEPMNRAEAADIAPAYWLQHPEVEVMNAVVVA